MSRENAWKKVSANVDINLDSEIVTYKTATRILLSIIEFLSYNRNQIPLVYETFNHLVQGLEKTTPNSFDKRDAADVEVLDFAMERQRDLAIQTNRKFQDIANTLIKSFKKHEIQQAMIVFGATTFTAKEAFVVNLPTISRNHLAENHLDSPQTITRKVIMSIIASSQFFDVNCTELKPTNMYVFLKPRQSIEDEIGEQFERHDRFKLPTMCRTTVLNIQNDSNAVTTNCCQDLSIFHGDFNPLDYSAGDATKKTERICDQTSSLIVNAPTKHVATNSESLSKTDSRLESNFYECKISVKGFKDQLIKGKSIWTQ